MAGSRQELGRVIVGQHAVIERLSICLFARGHGLLMGVPGLAKTLLVSKMAETMSLRVQPHPVHARPDADGHHRHRHSAGRRRRPPGISNSCTARSSPISCLADEINRAPPKTQAAMLEAMQEQKVTVVGKTFQLEAPFFVLATQNPVEQEGTYPLPEAQLDRFMFLIELDYPIRRGGGADRPHHDRRRAAGTGAHVDDGRDHRASAPGAACAGSRPHLQYAARLVRKTRPQRATAPAWLKPLVAWGAGPRAVQYPDSWAQRPRAALHGQLHGAAGGRPGGGAAGVDASRDHDIRRPGRRDWMPSRSSDG